MRVEAAPVVKGYEVLQQVGSGQYSRVFRGRNLATKSTVALKHMKVSSTDDSMLRIVANEVLAGERLQEAPNVVNLVEVVREVGSVTLVLEFCDGGTLDQLLAKRKFLQVAPGFELMRQILTGMKALVHHGIMHRDIKPENVFFARGEAKLGDFGFSVPVSRISQLANNFVGSPMYMAPEILNGRAYDSKADVWSLGVLFFEILHGRCPFLADSIPELISEIENRRLIFDETRKIPDCLQQAIGRMLQPDPVKRISFDFLFELMEEIRNDPSLSSSPFSKLPDCELKTSLLSLPKISMTPTQKLKIEIRLCLYCHLKCLEASFDFEEEVIPLAALSLLHRAKQKAEELRTFEPSAGAEERILSSAFEELSKNISHIPKNFESDSLEPSFFKKSISRYADYITQNFLSKILAKDDQLQAIVLHVILLRDCLSPSRELFVPGVPIKDQRYIQTLKKADVDDLMTILPIVIEEIDSLAE